MLMNTRFLYVLLIIAMFSRVYCQDSFSGKYVAENQAKYDSEKRWIEITRNDYQELIVSSENYTNVVAYYDIENQELFFVIIKPAQYNTLMKIRLVTDHTIEVYMLVQNKWEKSAYTFRKLQNN